MKRLWERLLDAFDYHNETTPPEILPPTSEINNAFEADHLKSSTTSRSTSCSSKSPQPAAALFVEESSTENVFHPTALSTMALSPPPIPPRHRPSSTSSALLSTSSSRSPTTESSYVRPCVANGVQLSHTHYWLLTVPPSRRSLSMRENSNSSNQSQDDTYVNLQSTSVPEEMWSERRRGSASHTSMVISSNLDDRKNKVDQLMLELLPAAPKLSEEEVYATLLGVQWQLPTARQKLKKELLFRKGQGRVSMEHCEKLLQRHHWDLHTAQENIIYEEFD